jgi:hypothetical protein
MKQSNQAESDKGSTLFVTKELLNTNRIEIWPEGSEVDVLVIMGANEPKEAKI